jgi:hypothetical protein
MKKIFSLAILALFTVIVSCTDESLDPLNFKSVKKGTLLALRGAFLQAIYIDGTAGASFVPLIADGTEKFTFDAEFLSEDPSTISSVDVYAQKANGDKVKIKTVPGSDFKTTSDYPRPWATITVGLSDVLTAIGITPSYPLAAEDVNTLITDYKFGVAILSDLNLTDGSKVTSDDLVAAGLYQSNQFYPAQNLPWAVVNYCPYVADTWLGSFTGVEIYAAGAGSTDALKFTQGDNPNEVVLHNFWGWGDDDVTCVLTFNPSTSPYDQTITIKSQMVLDPNGNGADGLITGTGTYDQCTGTFKVQVKYGPISADGPNGTPYEFRYEISPSN